MHRISKFRIAFAGLATVVVLAQLAFYGLIIWLLIGLGRWAWSAAS